MNEPLNSQKILLSSRVVVTILIHVQSSTRIVYSGNSGIRIIRFWYALELLHLINMVCTSIEVFKCKMADTSTALLARVNSFNVNDDRLRIEEHATYFHNMSLLSQILHVISFLPDNN